MSFWAACSEFKTDFHMALEMADNLEEQNALRPILREIIALYHSSKEFLLDVVTWEKFLRLLDRLNEVAEYHAALWLENYNSSAA